MKLPHGSAHLAVVPARDADSQLVPRAGSHTQLAEPARRSLDLLENSRALVEWVTTSVNELVGADRDAIRLREIATMLACEQARLLAYQELLDQQVLGGDVVGMVATLDRLVTSATKRVVALSAEHRACSMVGSGRRDVVVAVAHADSVHVSSLEK